MARSKRDILDTEAMLKRLAQLLAQHREGQAPEACRSQSRLDAERLRRISMTLHRWHEMECGDSNDHASWAIERDGDEPDSKPYLVTHPHGRSGEPMKSRRTPIADRETGARKRLAAILKRYPALTAYVQTDPRGCALYILTPEQVNGVRPDEIDAIYSRGLAVFK